MRDISVSKVERNEVAFTCRKDKIQCKHRIALEIFKDISIEGFDKKLEIYYNNGAL